MEKLAELEKEIRKRRRDGTEKVYHLSTMKDAELARRMALWHREKLSSYRREEERHKSRVYRWLVVECEGGRTLRLSAEDMSPYFRHRIGWTEEGVYHYEEEGEANWWILAPYFSI